MTTADRAVTRLRRRTLLAMVPAIGLAGAAKAQPAFDPVDLSVVDRETGQTLRVWRHGGRQFVAGRPGARYSLRVANRTDERILVVMSVDGVNVITGQTAGYSQGGYVFDPYQTYDVSGWRKSDREVAAFTFAPLPQSYAARTGRPGDVGVIGLAVFRERVVAPPAYEPRARDEANEVEESVVTGSRAGAAQPPAAAPSARRAAPSDAVTAERRQDKLGTAHGAREWSAVTSVAFERATSYPQLIRRIEYDSYENLVAMGVIRPSWGAGPRPRPFPASPGGGGYVPDPPGGR